MSATETPMRLSALVNAWFWFYEIRFLSSLSPPLFSVPSTRYLYVAGEASSAARTGRKSSAISNSLRRENHRPMLGS
jgi:hypothetical protein